MRSIRNHIKIKIRYTFQTKIEKSANCRKAEVIIPHYALNFTAAPRPLPRISPLNAARGQRYLTSATGSRPAIKGECLTRLRDETRALSDFALPPARQNEKKRILYFPIPAPNLLKTGRTSERSSASCSIAGENESERRDSGAAARKKTAR